MGLLRLPGPVSNGLCLLAGFLTAARGYHAGVGIADVTGPAAEVVMLGYGSGDHKLEGIHTRMYARAFVIVDKPVGQAITNSDPRVVYVVAETGLPDQRLKKKVLSKLEAEYGAGIYTQENVMLTVSHTHSAAGGIPQYFVYNVPSLGPVNETFQAVVEGTYRAIKQAHENLEPAELFYAKGDLDGASISRSPTSYLLNADINEYSRDRDIEMKQLVIYSHATGNPTGLINWFPVHATSMTTDYKLMDGDNKGLASQLMEKSMNPSGTLSGQGPFVAAYADSNSGDITAYTAGDKCTHDGSDCDALTSTCPGEGICVALGPGSDDYEGTEITANLIFGKSNELLSNTGLQVQVGPGLSFTHEFIDISNRTVTVDGTVHTTCSAALGASFLSGLPYAPGLQIPDGITATDPIWGYIVSILADNATQAMWDCQAPKLPLVPHGDWTAPYQWAPSVVDTQLFKIGDVVIVGLPSEYTTMAGRRLQKKIEETFAAAGNNNIEVVLAGFANVYTNYVTTREEYQAQRYEAASVLYGQYTLEAYLDQYEKLANALITGTSITSLVQPPDLTNEQIYTFTDYPYTGTIGESHPADQPPGFCKTTFLDEVQFCEWRPNWIWFLPPVYHCDEPTYQMQTFTRGTTVTAKFVAGHLRNNWEQPYDNQVDSFLYVERSTGGGQYTVIATDNDWETKLYWRSFFPGTESEVELQWDIPADAPLGLYRFATEGFSLLYHGPFAPNPYTYQHFNGVSNDFEVVA